MKKSFFALLLSIAIFAACGGRAEKKSAKALSSLDSALLPGDSSIYGLACEGGTDSVIYLLPRDGGDPVMYNIIDAHRRHRIMGRPKIGDWIAIVPNREKKNVADMVIDLEELKGTWCYIVMPKLKEKHNISKTMEKKFLDDMPDSMRSSYFVPREYGFTLMRHFKASAIGWVRQSTALEDESPVVYPSVPHYRQWHLLNGKLILSRAKNAMVAMAADEDKKKLLPPEELLHDTAEIIALRKDSLVLRFKDHQQSYYKIGNANDANKLARSKAEKLAKDAAENMKKENGDGTHVEEKREGSKTTR